MAIKINHVDVSFPTDICNMKCSYCFHRKPLRKRNNLNNFENEIIPILEKFTFDDEVVVDIVGGEVMLMIPKMYDVIRQFKKYERFCDTKFVYRITTNGTNASELVEMIDDGIYQPNMVTISYDGDNSGRGDINISSLIPFLKYANEVNINLSLSDKTIDRLGDIVDQISKFGFRNIEYYYLYQTKLYEDEVRCDNFRAQLDHIVKLHLDGDINLYNFTSAMDKKKDYDRLGHFKRGLNCKGLNNLTILSDGTFSPCGFMNEYMNPALVFTHTKDSSNEEIENSYNSIRRFYSKEHCDSANCKNYQCTGCMFYVSTHGSYTEQCKIRTVEREVFESYFDTID